MEVIILQCRHIIEIEYIIWSGSGGWVTFRTKCVGDRADMVGLLDTLLQFKLVLYQRYTCTEIWWLLSPVAARWHPLLFVLLSWTGFERGFFSLGLLTNNENCMFHIAKWTMHWLELNVHVFVCFLFSFAECYLLLPRKLFKLSEPNGFEKQITETLIIQIKRYELMRGCK